MTNAQYIYSNQNPESYTLNVHFNGLSYLYAFVRAEEEKMLTKSNLGFFAPFNDPGEVILNHFIWYSNSFVPFIDLFSRAFALEKKLWREFDAVRKWRNKVAAHFSLVYPRHRKPTTCPKCGALIKSERKGDSAMVQTASVNQYLTWSNGRSRWGER